jgi:GNAT superfamily N-acetyltransferase
MTVVRVANATEEDAAAVAAVRAAAAAALTQAHGRGHWSAHVTERAAVRAIATSHVLVARQRGDVIGTVKLDTKKPWAIDPTYFTTMTFPIYLHDLAVAPAAQGNGVGRSLVAAAVKLARELSRDCMRLDAYDHPAGAGPFYARCGFGERGRVTYRKTPLIYFQLLL